jgi:hypothetical protein
VDGMITMRQNISGNDELTGQNLFCFQWYQTFPDSRETISTYLSLLICLYLKKNKNNREKFSYVCPVEFKNKILHLKIIRASGIHKQPYGN